MSTFYGQVSGQAKTTASRRGSNASHIKASCQSYDGSVIMEMYYGNDGELCVRIEHNKGTKFSGDEVFDGTVQDFIGKLR